MRLASYVPAFWMWIPDTVGGPDKPEQLYLLFCDQTVTAALSQVSRRYRSVAYLTSTSCQNLFYFKQGHELHRWAPVLPDDPVRYMQTCTRCQERHSDEWDGQVYTERPNDWLDQLTSPPQQYRGVWPCSDSESVPSPGSPVSNSS